MQKKDEWIGGHLHEHDSMCGTADTEIIDILLEPGPEPGFVVQGRDFRFMANTRYLYISPTLCPHSLGLGTTWGSDSWIITPKAHVAEARMFHHLT